ncbi:MAG TPA: hypothetical protein PKU97_22515 [Kofleriaceae bacterium]|nr:hypothetical protein [Kofleriaceae bacterium]
MLASSSHRAALAVLLAAAVPSSGCLSRTYEIHKPELARLAATAPEVRGASVEVEQELFGSDLETAQPVTSSTQIVVIGSVDVGPRHPAPRPRPGSGDGGGGGGSSGGGTGGKATNAKEAAVAVLVLATFGVVIAAAVEAQRYEGTVQLHPMHPVHLFGYDGNYMIVPLAHLDPGIVQWSQRAVIRSNEGPFLFLQRAPLRRRGLTYGVHFGVSQLASADGTKTSGPSGVIHVGLFPGEKIGLLGTASFAWRENLVRQTLYEQRYGIELQAMPLAADIFHAGVYAGVGLAWRLEDGFSRGDDRGLAFSGGAQLQLDVNTHIALTARFGLHSGHDEYLREATFGMAVY